MLLEALIGADPKSDLIPKLVRGLLDHRVAGRWSSTQENGFVLVALDRYFDTFERATPDFVAKAWLGARFAGQHPLRVGAGGAALAELEQAARALGDPGRFLGHRAGFLPAPLPGQQGRAPTLDGGTDLVAVSVDDAPGLVQQRVGLVVYDEAGNASRPVERVIPLGAAAGR